MMNILVTGGNGQLGSELRVLSEKNEHQFFFTDRSTLDIANHEMVRQFLLDNKIEAVINCAAYTAVDKAEEDQDLAYAINHLAVENFAQLAKEFSLRFVHISTDYVFDGNGCRPYIETDSPSPQSVYGSSKLKGEEAILKIQPENTIIIRTSWVYSSFGSNFVKTMLRLSEQREQLGVIFDQIGTPTYARHLAEVILEILPQINNDEVEIYHFSNEGVCSWFDFAKTIFEMSDIHMQVDAIESSQYPTPAKRPFYSVLNKKKIKSDFNLTIPYWKEGLKACLQELL